MFSKLISSLRGEPPADDVAIDDVDEIAGLKDLLSFIASQCTFLFLDNRFRLVDSYVEASSFDGNCAVFLQSASIRMQFIRDRCQNSLDFWAASDEHEGEWYSIDIVRQAITGEKACTGLMDAENTRFLRQNIDAVEKLFAADALPTTIPRLKRLEVLRANRLFGPAP